ncbi:glutamyl-tRNA reductase [Calidifontibacter sp. DB0510]|uniref:Glutamyl-tRNA reductase n=1 Tax=Metallococcus carri TaxID=1656884 RepID=A0A967E9K8_9MICO|nr:glutamyl-tRNA reductase [Metallococcus carri]NHN55320.1 glutamyl-tRNA reductase [Metallococcus carri]NOP36397.1 glutamyl-tRNA reductase [Calidifontibacter sp. DB2511S]
MSLIALGLSHRSAPVELLERASLTPERSELIDRQLRAAEHLHEWMVVSTCNRVEIYGDVATFHGSVVQITDALAQATGLSVDELRDSLYVHFEDRAVAHLFSVAAGLDSLAVGEAQILGQLRTALRLSREHGHIGPVLETVAQQALRVGKRVHAETEIDTISRSLVHRGLDVAAAELGDLSRVRAAVVGAGAMSALAAHTLTRAGIGSLTIVNRTRANAERLAEATGAAVRDWAELDLVLSEAQLVVTCTGAVGHVLSADQVIAAHGQARQVYVDLALPRDIEPGADGVPGVSIVSLERLQQLDAGAGAERLAGVEDLVTGEVAEFLASRRAATVGPTVAALRAYAADVVAAELSRLDGRTTLSESDRAQVQLAVHRVVEKLLHTPTVRMKELASGDQDYAALVRTLFDLDPHSSRVSQIPPGVSGV